MIAAANCKLTEIGADYRGNMNTTKSGYTCQRWDTQKPHKHESNTPETKPHSGLDHNYCRNPDQEPMGPWCYTTTPGKRWEYCNIKLCKSGRLLMHQRNLSSIFLNSPQNKRVDVVDRLMSWSLSFLCAPLT